MNRKKRFLIIFVTIVILIGTATCSADLMLRAAVFPVSPVSAFTLKYRIVEESESDNAMLYVITDNVPVEKDMKGELITWIVYNFGPFHFAKYYGEG